MSSLCPQYAAEIELFFSLMVIFLGFVTYVSAACCLEQLLWRAFPNAWTTRPGSVMATLVLACLFPVACAVTRMAESPVALTLVGMAVGGGFFGAGKLTDLLWTRLRNPHATTAPLRILAVGLLLLLPMLISLASATLPALLLDWSGLLR